MKKYKKEINLSLITSVILYLIVSFVKWDIIWIFEVNKWSISGRSMFVVVFLAKIFLEQMLYRLSKI